MTPEEINAEWNYRYQERLGILIDGNRQPTKEDHNLAWKEATEILAKLKALDATSF
jgi:hypothetical protein